VNPALFDALVLTAGLVAVERVAADHCDVVSARPNSPRNTDAEPNAVNWIIVPTQLDCHP
ncbi:MAG: hypothetical protein Q7J57_12780, partial [Gemmobacter sp.]|nr:hypothetical protein [Gemmobacter sp.]